MIFHPDGSLLLHHFIRPEYLIALLEKRAFHLTRQDLQPSDPNDGVLPPDCFSNPYIGSFERAHRIDKNFAISQAYANASLRPRTYIMSWTKEPTEQLRQRYGENGGRCEIRASLVTLMAMVGYSGVVPPHQEIQELPGLIADAELKPTRYVDRTRPISVFPSAFATECKDAKQFHSDEEIRIKAVVDTYELDASQMPKLILWNIRRFTGLSVTLAPRISDHDREEISRLCKELSVPISP